MVKLFDPYEPLEVIVEELRPVVVWDQWCAILLAYKLHSVAGGTGLNCVRNVLERADVHAPVPPFQESKAPVWRELGVPSDEEVERDVPTCTYVYV